MRSTMNLAALLLAVLLSACGAGDQYVFELPGGPIDQAVDDQLQLALADAGVAPVSAPPADPAALVALGRALFFDKELSGNRNISCATCHHAITGTGDQLPVSLGQGGSGVGANREQGGGNMIPRNAPHVFNAGVAGVHSMFWDSRVARDPFSGELTTPEAGLNGANPSLAAQAGPLDSALAAQAMFPVTSPDEMRGQSGGGADALRDASTNEEVWLALMERLVGTSNGTVGGIEAYRILFAAAFPAIVDFDNLTFGHAAQAIAAFERTAWTALSSPFDLYLGGDMTALSAAAKRGALLFYGRAGCMTCHSGPLLSDFDHHAVCIPQVGPGKGVPFEDRGLALETGDVADNYKFRTPTLRNVALTGPWMHDGAFTTLEAAVRHQLDPLASLANYDVGQLPAKFSATLDQDPSRNAARSAALDAEMTTPVGLSESEIKDLMTFLHSLTDPASLNLLRDIPDTVPSGLPVRD